MRIGVVSDTHDNLRNVHRIVELFNESNVDRVVHTGDITQPKTLDVLAGIDAPIVGVFGNNDHRESLREAADRLGIELFEPPLELQWSGRKLVVVHDPLELKDVDDEAYDVILYGHVHRQIIDYTEGRLTFNPGECAGVLKGHNAIGVLDLTTLATEIIKF